MPKSHVIDGKALAQNLTDQLKKEISNRQKPRSPGLATVLVGRDPASAIYVANKRKKAEEVGIKSFHYQLDESATQKQVLDLIASLNQNPNVDAILVQLPLPRHINEITVIDALDAKKDVDGFHPLNLGYLLRGDPRVIACTPLGVMYILQSAKIELKGRHAVVVGRSTIVGKPMAHLLLQADATVTICHKETNNLADLTRQADILVVAVGQAKLITRHHIKKGAVVVDIGINRDENKKICGDVDFLDVVDVASFITPVPGGVGPLTIAMLLQNAFNNYRQVVS